MVTNNKQISWNSGEKKKRKRTNSNKLVRKYMRQFKNN